MRSRKKQIFEDNIVIPDIVQEKAESAFEIIRKERAYTMKEKNYKINGQFMGKNRGRTAALGICACTALMLVTGTSGLLQKENTGTEGITDQTSQRNEILQAIENSFTVKVYAAENEYVNLENGKEVPLSLRNDVGDYVLCANEDGGISYCISTNFLCEGDNIESITYSINHGALQVVEPKDASIVTEGVKYEGELNTGAVGVEEEKETTGEIQSVQTNYKSFTVSYENQNNEQTWINICGNSDKNWNELFGDGKDSENMINGLDELMEDVLITCTVQYTDGSVGEKQITIGGGIYHPEEMSEAVETPEKAQPFETFVFRLQDDM